MPISLLSSFSFPITAPAGGHAPPTPAPQIYTLHDLISACTTGTSHGFAAGVLISIGLFYFWHRWLSPPANHKQQHQTSNSNQNVLP